MSTNDILNFKPLQPFQYIIPLYNARNNYNALNKINTNIQNDNLKMTQYLNILNENINKERILKAMLTKRFDGVSEETSASHQLINNSIDTYELAYLRNFSLGFGAILLFYIAFK
jgi:hypothetical protein